MLFRSLFSYVATLVYAVYEIRICFGRGKRLFESCLRKFWDEMVQIVQICTNLDYPSEKTFLLLKLYLLTLFVCVIVTVHQFFGILHSTYVMSYTCI